jgi:hypothetical protein
LNNSWEQSPPKPVRSVRIQDIPKRPDRRHRGEHSTAALCDNPSYRRPADFDDLPHVLRQPYVKILAYDEQGNPVLRRHISSDLLLLHLREAAGRVRGFRKQLRALMDAAAPLLLSCVDVATFICSMNVSQLADALSPKDETGKVIKHRRVTVYRVSRLLKVMSKFGLVELPPLRWDYEEGTRLPRHIMLTARFFEICGANMNNLMTEQRKRLDDEKLRSLAIAAGVIRADEELSPKSAQRRWYRHQTHMAILERRRKSAEGKRHKKLSRIKRYDDLKYAIGLQLRNRIKRGELLPMSDAEFSRAVYLEAKIIRELEPFQPGDGSPPPVTLQPGELPF